MPATPGPEVATFNAYKKALISSLGRKALDNTTINKIGRKQLAGAWGGCWAQDEVKLKPHHYYIVNTDTSSGPGTHWIAVYTSANTAYVYDSYGRNPANLVHWFIRNLDKHGWKLGATNLNHHAEQIGYTSEVCGHDSLAWLLTVRDLGIRSGRRI